MATWTEMEAQDEVELRKLAKVMDEFDAEETAAKAELNARLKAAPAEAKAKVSARIAELHARNEAARTALDDRIVAQIKQWSAEMDKVDAQVNAADEKAIADLEARRSALRANLAEAQAKLHASLTAQLNGFKSNIEELEARGAAANADVRARISAQVAALRKQVESTQHELQQLKEARSEPWTEHKARMDRALADLRENMQIPVGAVVSCSDGICGISTHVLVNPITRKVTHLVVQEVSLQHPEYMVPVDYVTAGSSDAILLRCSRNELRHIDPFVQTRYIYEPMPDYDSAYTVGTYFAVIPEVMTHVPVAEEQIPLGELAVRHGMRVEAADDTVGHVDELLMDPGTGRVTHLVMREGHLWGAKDVAIPVSAIEYANDDTVTLRLSKQEIAALPSISIRRPPIPPSLNQLTRAY